MMATKSRIGLLAALALSAASASNAADFDGSKALICAPVEAMDCTPGSVCDRDLPAQVGAPAFVRIDFQKKVVIGPRRTTPIASITKNESEVLIQGTELSFGWSIAVEQKEGRMAATLTNQDGVFVLFGSCAPL